MRRKTAAIVLAWGGACLALLIAPGTGASASPRTAAGTPSSAAASTATSGAAAQPGSPTDYAAATFEAWLGEDTTRLLELTTPRVGVFLTARTSADPKGWNDPVCEGAAGSTLCTWTRHEAQMVIQVANEPASQRQPHAVTQASLEVTGHNVAYWPFATAKQARNTQAEVDQGSSPWLLDPIAVSTFLAQAELGWSKVLVEEVAPFTHWATDPASGGTVEVEIAQPVRQGEGGIWAVTRVSSTASEPTAPLLGYEGYKTLYIGQPDPEAQATGLLVDRQPYACIFYYLHPDEGLQNPGSGVFVDPSLGVVWIGGTDRSRTPEGAAMGSTFEAVKAVYPSLTPLPPTDFVYSAPVPGHPDLLYVFAFDDANRVSDFGLQAKDMGACNSNDNLASRRATR
jgi:hypothetical protein